MAISSEQSLTTYLATSLPFDKNGQMPPWRPTPAFWLRRLSIALALALIALVYFITPMLMRDGPSLQTIGTAIVNNGCSPGGLSDPITATCTLMVQFTSNGVNHSARLQRSLPFPSTLSEALVTYHERSLLGLSAFSHLVVTRVATPSGQVLTGQGVQIVADAQAQLPGGIPQAVALAVLLAAVFTFFYPWPAWKVRVNAEVLAMRVVEVRNADHLPRQRHLATLRWQTSILMKQEVRIPGKLSRRLRPGDRVLLTYEHLRSGTFKALRVHLPQSHKGWLAPDAMQIGALTPWRWRWLFIALLWLEIPVSLLLLAAVS